MTDMEADSKLGDELFDKLSRKSYVPWAALVGRLVREKRKLREALRLNLQTLKGSVTLSEHLWETEAEKLLEEIGED